MNKENECWFDCKISLENGKAGFSTEFDTWVHEDCIKAQSDDNPEKRIFMNEFKLK